MKEIISDLEDNIGKKWIPQLKKMLNLSFKKLDTIWETMKKKTKPKNNRKKERRTNQVKLQKIFITKSEEKISPI